MNIFSTLSQRLARGGRRGFASMIGLLMVLLIILSLVQMGYFQKDKKTGKTQAQEYEDRGKRSACLADQTVLRSEIQQVMIGFNGRLPATNVLRAKFARYHCPGKGVFQLDQQGNVYCTEHSPSPESSAITIINLYDAPPPAAATPEQSAK